MEREESVGGGEFPIVEMETGRVIIVYKDKITCGQVVLGDAD